MARRVLRRIGSKRVITAFAAAVSVLGSGYNLIDVRADAVVDHPAAVSTGRQASGAVAVIDLDLDRVRRLAGHGRFVIEAFPLQPDLAVDLDVERFRLTGPETRFVLGHKGAPDIPLDFDPDQIVLLRGEVIDHPGSHVFLGLTDRGGIGRIDLGPGAEQFQVSANGGSGIALERGQLAVFPAAGGGVVAPDVEPCRLVVAGDIAPPPTLPHDRDGSGPRGGGSTLNEQHIELAIETDYELYALFGNADDTLTYVMQLYAANSDIYIRDANTRMALSFVRIWDTPDDLFNMENPLSAFRSYWIQNMGDVHRDTAQFCSGRVNMPYGGAAYIDGLCNNGSYSVCGYILGYFVSPDAPHVFNYDIMVTAHELGHNCGAWHTHDYGLDTCNEAEGPAQRGTIMSYCGQTRSGGNANHDLRFHSLVQGELVEFITSVECVADDCNRNGIDDADDIADGTSDDVNGNGVPDECEDCNGNGQLDDEDILDGTSQDLNGNGIPDECEPDCNENGVPDDADISGGFSEDLNANNIPDECEEDCDGNGTADYLEIMDDMSLDLDRNARFDACQDCDDDGTPDLVELDGAHDVWVATSTTDHVIRQFHAVTGAMVRESEPDAVATANDLIIDDAGRIFVSSADDARIVEFDRAGSHVQDLVPSGGGGLVEPTGLTIGPGGHIFVADAAAHAVREYDRDTGDYVGAFVAPGAGEIIRPFGLAFGLDGNLFVTSDDNRVLEYDGETGAFVGEFVTESDNGGLSQPRGVLFNTDGNLLVASLGTNAVLEFDGQTGAFLGQFNDGGTAEVLTMDEPWSIRIGPDGDVYVSRHGTAGGPPGGGPHLHLTQARVYQFTAETGRMVRAYLIGNDTGLDFPTGFDFMPGDQTDCNFNQIPDICDIADGTSDDVNGNGVPDECEPPLGDMNCDFVVDFDDLEPFATALTDPDAYEAEFPACNINLADVNGDGSRNGLDIPAFVDLLLSP